MSHFHANHDATQKLLEEWGSGPGNRLLPSTWIRSMLVAERRDRPSSAVVATEITASEFNNSFMYSCSMCCASESDSDYSESIENEEGTSSRQAESQVPTPLVLGDTDNPQKAFLDANFRPFSDVRQNQRVYSYVPITTAEGTENAQEADPWAVHSSEFWRLFTMPGSTTSAQDPTFSVQEQSALLKDADLTHSTDLRMMLNDYMNLTPPPTQDYDTRDAKRRAIDPNADRDNFLPSMKLPEPNGSRSPYYLYTFILRTTAKKGMGLRNEKKHRARGPTLPMHIVGSHRKARNTRNMTRLLSLR
ncbi:hypothetical protein EJ07DRAFT_151661 [Lizonia empirigonia]|nr:hypothetical protein EJ07DRAFT_151661 [Lizonia empirigonia]